MSADIKPAGFRTRYRSDPGMIGHYPWTYEDIGQRRTTDRPSCEYEDFYTADQMRAAVAAAVEQCAVLCDADDKSTHPSDLADRIRATLPAAQKEKDHANKS